MSENSIPSFFDDVWNNWCTGTGPCFECPNRDSQCHFYPKFGQGVLDAEIAFVAETPNEENRESQNSPKARKEQYGEFKNKIRRDPVPTWTKKRNRFSDSFFRDISGDFSGERERGIYYTNIKKCGDIEGGRVGWKNRKSKLHCEQYLIGELQAVDPDIVITFGKKATESLFEVFDHAESFDNIKDVTMQIHHINSYKIVPSIHWSNLHMNIKELEKIESKQDYWTTLAEKINSIVES